MGIYTVLDDKKVDETIANDLRHIIEKVTAATSVYAIILGGGFGRGEGSVLVDQDGIRPVNDYDLFIIVSDEDQTDFRSLSREIASEIGIRLLDLIPIKYSALITLPPTQFNYDLKYGGRHLWGKEVLNLIPDYKEGIVDIEAGRTLLLNRLICAIEAYSEGFKEKGMTGEEKFFLVNQTGKVISACVEAMLIKKGRYHHSYRRRKEIFEVQFPWKAGLLLLNKRATDFKLKPTETPDFDAVKYWEEAVNEYIKVVADYFLQDSTSPNKDLWGLLKNNGSDASITNYPIERVELMLLLYKKASFFAKRDILSRALRELADITKTPLTYKRWEDIRERTARLWHELYH